MSKFTTSLVEYMMSGHGLLLVRSHEKDRVTEEIKLAAKEAGREHVFTWNVALGWLDENGRAVEDIKSTQKPEDDIPQIQKLPEKSVCILRDFRCYMESATYGSYWDVIIGWIDVLKQNLGHDEKTIIFLGPDFEIPLILQHDITEVEFSLPDEAAIEQDMAYIIECTANGSEQMAKEISPPDEETRQEIVRACKGMTRQEIQDRLSLAMQRHKKFTADAAKTVLHEKAGVIRSSGMLMYRDPPPGGLDNVGGLQLLKQHIILDMPCFTPEAREFGIDPPKGILLVGIPGGGKTLISLAIAGHLRFPLISMDMSDIMDKFVGGSEGKMRDAIKLIESQSPCVLQLDEVEKSFGGSGDLDGGTTRRVFGTFLKWLNDRTCPIYVVATANQTEGLPPEFLRKGRFDEIFGVDLPETEERMEIVNIHLRKRRRDPAKFDVRKIAESCNEYTGADIEQAVIVGLKTAFVAKRDLTTEDVLGGIKSVIPLMRTDPDRISEIRTWVSKHAKRANEKAAVPSLGTPKTRKIKVAS